MPESSIAKSVIETCSAKFVKKLQPRIPGWFGLTVDYYAWLTSTRSRIKMLKQYVLNCWKEFIVALREILF